MPNVPPMKPRTLPSLTAHRRPDHPSPEHAYVLVDGKGREVASNLSAGWAKLLSLTPHLAESVMGSGTMYVEDLRAAVMDIVADVLRGGE